MRKRGAAACQEKVDTKKALLPKQILSEQRGSSVSRRNRHLGPQCRPGDETFVHGSTGDVLQGLGAIESDIHVQSNQINTIFKDHPEMTIQENNLYLSNMQKVVSAYTKDNSPTAAMRLIQNSDVLYADKEKTASLLHTVGFQNAYRIEQSGYIGNIA